MKQLEVTYGVNAGYEVWIVEVDDDVTAQDVLDGKAEVEFQILKDSGFESLTPIEVDEI